MFLLSFWYLVEAVLFIGVICKTCTLPYFAYLCLSFRTFSVLFVSVKSSFWLGKWDQNWGGGQEENLCQILNMLLSCWHNKWAPLPWRQALAGLLPHAVSWGMKDKSPSPPAPRVIQLWGCTGNIPTGYGHCSLENYNCIWEERGVERDFASQVCPSQSRFHTEPGLVVCRDLKFSSKISFFSLSRSDFP